MEVRKYEARINENTIVIIEMQLEDNCKMDKRAMYYASKIMASSLEVGETDLPISDKNIEATINIGRKRWKIENEGFNIQKNRTFDIEHLYSKNSTAIKVHYLMIQIAHIIRQLLEKGTKEIKTLKLKLKEISQILI